MSEQVDKLQRVTVRVDEPLADASDTPRLAAVRPRGKHRRHGLGGADGNPPILQACAVNSFPRFSALTLC